MLNAVDYDSDGYDWPDNKLGRQLTSLEESMLCPICQGLFNNPQLLNCGHSFCSLCIRKHLDRSLNLTTSDVCPACREKAESHDLKVNRSLATLVSSFKGLRKDLIDSLSASDKSNIVDLCDSKEHKVMHKKDRSHIVVERIAHCNFHGMSKDKVKKTIEGVLKNTRNKLKYDGDKDLLEKRFREVVHLNNAQIGSQHPLTMDEIIKIVNDKEVVKELEAKKSLKTVSKLEKLKNGEQVQELESNFSALAKKAMEQKKSKAAAAVATASAATSTKHLTDSNCTDLQSDLETPLLTQDTASLLMEDAIPIFDPRALTNTFDRLENPKLWGPWRVIINSKDGRPFYFHVDNRVGQFDVPWELMKGNATTLATISGTGNNDDVEEETEEAKAHNSVGSDLLASMSAVVEGDLQPTEAGVDDEVSVDVTDLFPESQVYSTSQNVNTAAEEVQPSQLSVSGVKSKKAMMMTQKSPQRAVHDEVATSQQPQSQSQHQIDQWSCSSCTFLNQISSRTCDMCGTVNTSFINSRAKRLSGTQKGLTEENVDSSVAKPSKKQKH